MRHPTTSKQPDDDDHPEDCVCEDCELAREALEDRGELSSDDILVSDIEGLGCDLSFEDSETDDPDDVGPLFDTSAAEARRIQDGHVAYKNQALGRRVFDAPPADALVPYVRRNMCEPLVHGKYSLYAFEYHRTHDRTTYTGLAVFDEQDLTSVAVLQPDTRPCRGRLAQGRILRLEVQDLTTQAWSRLDPKQGKAWAQVIQAVAADQQVVFEEAFNSDLQRALALNLFDPDGP